ncbi:MAG: helix-turn-helix domain-containing protein [Deltaproteobacteria bacterium]|nr:helix-turn-helix domain-containing protein [Deltaproteobacteria bacterium]
MKPLKSQNYYEILGIPRKAAPEDIRKAYENAKHTFQSNSLATYSLFSDQENQEILSLISRAYETLYNRQTRTEYDSLLESLGGDLSPLTDRRPTSRDLNRGSESTHVQPMVQLGQSSPGGGNSLSTLSSPSHPSPTLGTTVGKSTGSPAPSAPAKTPPKPEPEKPREEARPKLNPASEKAVEDLLRGVDMIDGKVLRRVRQIRGISIDDIAQQTKIRKAYIQYLEEEQFEFLPAPIYVRGFITMIASILRLPQQRVADDYMKIYKTKTL